MKMLRHTGIYFLARIVAGSATFTAIAVYTRVLSAQEFGELTLALTGVGFFGLLFMEGPFLAMLRYLPGNSNAARANTLWGLIIPVAALCLFAATVALVAAPNNLRASTSLAATLFGATVLHRFQLTTLQGALQPWQYALLGGIESVLETAFGISFVLLGYGVAGALSGSILALILVILFNIRFWWVEKKYFDGALWRQMAKFALPLSAGAALGWAASFSDRWLLAIYSGAQQAGLYGAAYDLPLNLLGVPFMVIMLASTPLAINAYDKSGSEAARVELRQFSTFIALILFPAAIGILLTGPLLVNVFLGEAFRPLALAILPLLCAAIFVKSLIWFANYGYMLRLRSDLALLSMAVTAASNLLFNFFLIPRYGAMGSGIAALAAFSIGFVVTVAMLRKVFPVPHPEPAVIVAASFGVAAMSAWLWSCYGLTHWPAILYVIPISVGIYGSVTVLILQLAGQEPLEWLRKLSQGTDYTKA